MTANAEVRTAETARSEQTNTINHVLNRAIGDALVTRALGGAERRGDSLRSCCAAARCWRRIRIRSRARLSG